MSVKGIFEELKLEAGDWKKPRGRKARYGIRDSGIGIRKEKYVSVTVSVSVERV
jgi:hypothetical protein